MRFKKYTNMKSQIKKSDAERVHRLKCKLLMAPKGSFKWAASLDFTVDTGSDMPVIPRKLLAKLGLEGCKVIDIIETEMADGSVSNGDLISCNMRLLTNDSCDRDTLVDVQCLIVEDGDEPLLGISILNLYDYIVISGKLILLRQNQGAWAELQDANIFKSYQIGLSQNSSQKPILPWELPEVPTAPPLPIPPGSVPAKPGAFLPPIPPKKQIPPK